MGRSLGGQAGLAMVYAGHWTSAEFGANPNSVDARTDSLGEFVPCDGLLECRIASWRSLSLAAGVQETLTILSAGEEGQGHRSLKKTTDSGLADRCSSPTASPSLDS